MRVSTGFRAALIVVIALAFPGLSSAARADGGGISFSVLKGGWFVGASAGQGVVHFHGRVYPISIGGISAGLVFGGSQTVFRGTVSNIRSPYDVAGVYAAVGGGAAVGVQVNLDLSGLAITMR
jgi:hypothetical protein